MKLLIIGGTRFLGRHIAEIALARGHELTLFHRGKTHPELFPGAEKLHGDRGQDLELLRGRQWDAVIDTCGYVPRMTQLSATALSKAVERYIFISTISVYADFSKPVHEGASLATLEDESVEEITGETYGALKALCEQSIERTLPGRTLIIRPGLIVGPNDLTDRFTYWPYRVAQGGEVLAPGQPEDQTQFIDVRDLSAWTVHMAEARKAGIYNATGPASPLTIGQFLEETKAVTGSSAHFTWVSSKFLEEQGAEELPLATSTGYEEIWKTDCTRALQDGLTFHSLESTIRDTMAWKGEIGSIDELRAGLKQDQEQELLRKWKSAQ